LKIGFCFQVARRGSKFGMPAPMLVQFEREIDREIARDQKRERAGSTGDGSGGDLNGADLGDDSGAGLEEEEEEEEEEEDYSLQYGPVPQIVTNDLKSLDEMVSTKFSNFESYPRKNDLCT